MAQATRLFALAAIAAVVFCAGCATKRNLTPKITFGSLTADVVEPQLAGSTVRWIAVAEGGVGQLTYEFRYRLDGEEEIAQVGPSSTWDWTPDAVGTYVTRVIVRDALGYTTDSGWSPEYEIAPALALTELEASVDSPQRAKVQDIFWSLDATGGVGDLTYEFWLSAGTRESLMQTGSDRFWKWSPWRPGAYRVQAVVRDERGNTAASGWSEIYGIFSPLSPDGTIAVLPFENLSGRDAPLKAIRESLLEALKSRGLQILPDQELDRFMARHRMRYVGGLSSSLGSALAQETGAAAVLVSAVEQYFDADPPRFSIVSRLVSAGEKTHLLWMEGVAGSGNESPGAFDLKRVRFIDTLREEVLAQIADSLSDHVKADVRGSSTDEPLSVKPTRAGLRPKGFYRSPDSVQSRDGHLRIAVLPFENDTNRADAGRLMELHFVRQLVRRPDIEVVEPGKVRQTLLRSRLIFDEGPSLPQADLLRALAGVDMVITGTVTDYDDPVGEWGVPVVGFSARGIEPERRTVGWTSVSHSHGNSGAFFFDLGKVRTAYDLASAMVGQVVVQAMAEQ